MAEVCKHCDRPDCPNCPPPTMPTRTEAVKDSDFVAWAHACDVAIRNCQAHAVDWRARYLAVAAFAGRVLAQHREHLADVDGGDVHDWAEASGFLEKVAVTKPCCTDCRCRDYDDFPQDCTRYSDLGKAVVVLGEEAGRG